MNTESNSLATLLSVLSNPQRLQLVATLRDGERDVGALHTSLGIRRTTVSQHLAVLRAHRIVNANRRGQHVFYSLRDHELAHWLTKGIKFAPEP